MISASVCIARQGHVIIHIPLAVLYGIAFIENQKWKNKIYEPGKVDDRISILQ